MTDTDSWAEAKLAELFARCTASERLQMASRSFEIARALALSSLRQQFPNANPDQLRLLLFERFYRPDFPPGAWEKWLEIWRTRHCSERS